MSGLPVNRNGLWDRVIADTLAACGVRRALLCPGGRASMLAMTLHRTPGLTCTPHVDERSAGFMALGTFLAGGGPTAVCTTSGTAVANLLPAMAEAGARGLPIVLLTCDRPTRGRLPGEPQWMPQVAVCSPLARSQLSLPDPLDGSMTLGELQEAVAAALVRGLGGERPGPVHINIPQWGVYCATEDDPPGDVALPPPPIPGRIGHPTADVAEVTQAVRRSGAAPGGRGVILACADQPLPETALAELLDMTGYPLIADVASGTRHLGLPGTLTAADALAEGDGLAFDRAELLIRLGSAPVCPGLVRAVKQARCPVIRIARHDPGPDFLSPEAIGLWPPTPDAMTAFIAALGRGDEDWAHEWATSELVASATREIVVAAADWGEVAAVGRICAARGFAALHCANSLSVRLMSFLMPAGHGPPRVFSARGVNGTDGTLGMVLGEALAIEGPMLALVGDQSFVHDLPALASPLWRDVRGAICVMNNGGGGLFDLTAARRIDAYEATMRNSPAIEIAGVAQAFDLVHRPCSDRAQLDAALAEAARGEALHLLEIRVPPGTAARDLPRLVSAVRSSVDAVGSTTACAPLAGGAIPVA